MTDFVSAVENGQVVTMSRALATTAGLEVVDRPACDRYGRPLAPRPLERSKPAKKAASRKRAPRKASAKKAASKTTTAAPSASKPEEGSA